ncbi:MAG: hypothetical protein C0402_08895 [Thermodesulfovibrio sp.]|nr:hypothetical protein [Thermodesulfovibrio sp.]
MNTPSHIKLDERNHVEKPLLDQLVGLGWEILDLDSKQLPGDSHRQSFTEVVVLPVLRGQLKVINDIEPNHTPRFWNIVRTQTPTMEKAKLWLKDHGQLLEQVI